MFEIRVRVNCKRLGLEVRVHIPSRYIELMLESQPVMYERTHLDPTGP
jgi:hypothetical protein